MIEKCLQLLPRSGICVLITSAHRHGPLLTQISCHRQMFTKISSRRVGTGVVTPVFLRAEDFRWRTAIIDDHGQHTYGQVTDCSTALSGKILNLCSALQRADKVTGPRIAFLCPNDVSYVVTQWAVWKLGAVAVPLSPSHPQSEIEYFLHDSQASAVVTTPGFSARVADVAKKLNITHIEVEDEDFLSERSTEPQEATRMFGSTAGSSSRSRPKSQFDDFLATNQFKRQAALIIYTSGTTGRPKVGSSANLIEKYWILAVKYLKIWGKFQML